MSAEVRSGNVAANRAHIGPPSAPPKSAARSEPAASITAPMSSMSSSNEPSVRSPIRESGSRRSNTMSRENDAILSKNSAYPGRPLVLLEV